MLSDWILTTKISVHIPSVVKRGLPEPTRVEIVALIEKATPENTKKRRLNMQLRILTAILKK